MTPGINDETRDERNERFDAADKTPEWSVPDGGQYLLDWFDEIASGHNRVVGNQVKRISWAEFVAWQQATQNIVYPHEFSILRKMDEAYCEGMTGEVEYATAKARADAEARAAVNRRGK